MLLVIETATAACSVALIDGGAVVGERHEVVGRGHAERLIPQIDALLAACGARGAVTEVCVDCGPGSFTGVRVGIAAARALGLGWGVPVRGYSSLALIAAMGIDGAATATAAVTGGHGELFVQSFAAAPLRPLGSLRSAPPGEAPAEALVLGSGAAALVAARGRGTARDLLPRAADFVRLPAALAALPPTPIYGRMPDAKVPAGAPA